MFQDHCKILDNDEFWGAIFPPSKYTALPLFWGVFDSPTQRLDQKDKKLLTKAVCSILITNHNPIILTWFTCENILIYKHEVSILAALITHMNFFSRSVHSSTGSFFFTLFMCNISKQSQLQIFSPWILIVFWMCHQDSPFNIKSSKKFPAKKLATISHL